MKKSILSLISVALVYVFSATVVSCSNYESPLTGQKVDDIVMEETEGFYDVTFGNADLSNIKAQSSETWCTPTVSAKTIRINAQANDTYEERKAVVTLTDSKEGTTLTFNVIQKQNNAIITFGSEYLLMAEGGICNFHFQTNVFFTVEIPATCDWLKEVSQSATRGLQMAEITLMASPNTGNEPREVTFNIVNHDLGLSTPIKLHQLFQGQPYPY